MYLLVTNIPNTFRTPDLRNFFSQAIEEGVFNCFHYRHRPHENFMTLLSDWHSKMLSESGADVQVLERGSHGNKCDICGLNQAHALAPTGFEVENSDYQVLPDKCGKSKCSNYETFNRSDPKSTNGSSTNNTCKCQEMTEGAPLLDECNSIEIEKNLSRINKDSHWLSSGLSGLSSLIKDKKQKANQEQSRKQSRISIFNNDNDTLKCANERVDTLGTENITVKEVTHSEFLNSADGSCCIIDVKEIYLDKLLWLYHKKYWVNRQGDIQPKQCFILDLDLGSATLDTNDAEKDYLTRGSTSDLQCSLMDIKNMIEFCPPSVMPQGNIGTPTVHFQNLIRSCQLPGTIITKLGLQFPRRRGKKRFGEVPFDYGTEVYSGDADNQEKYVAFTASGHLIPASVDFTCQKRKPKEKSRKCAPKLELENEAEDGAEVEEWDRYEAFHNDVTSQDRTKERLYEKDIELVWEKGGPGLVFYTDAQYWREQEGDFDEQTTDEWDVDMSIYYEKGAGDKDARDSVGMLHSNDLRSGALTQSAFRSKGKTKNDGSEMGQRRKRGPAAPPKIGKFEAHTLGFGRRLMESQGWEDGVGLGRRGKGMPYALDNDGQHPHDRKGFGFHGEKLEGWGQPSTSSTPRYRQRLSKQSDSDCEIRISTVFDAPRDTDPPAPPLRTREPTTLSHRQGHISFTKCT